MTVQSHRVNPQGSLLDVFQDHLLYSVKMNPCDSRDTAISLYAHIRAYMHVHGISVAYSWQFKGCLNCEHIETMKPFRVFIRGDDHLAIQLLMIPEKFSMWADLQELSDADMCAAYNRVLRRAYERMYCIEAMPLTSLKDIQRIHDWRAGAASIDITYDKNEHCYGRFDVRKSLDNDVLFVDFVYNLFS